jgi:hypothetical protein
MYQQLVTDSGNNNKDNKEIKVIDDSKLKDVLERVKELEHE